MTESLTLLTGRCWIGPLGLHTLNHERTECIWCGPDRLAWQPGTWIDNGDGTSAWSADHDDCYHSVNADSDCQDNRSFVRSADQS